VVFETGGDDADQRSHGEDSAERVDQHDQTKAPAGIGPKRAGIQGADDGEPKGLDEVQWLLGIARRHAADHQHG
jgi:hypothetical protein